MATDNEIRGIILGELYSKYQDDPFNYVDKTKMMENTGIGMKNVIDRNVKYLEEKGLIKVTWSIGGGFIAQITAYGIDVISNKDDLNKFHDTFSVDFGAIKIEGDVNAPIIIGSNINITDSFNQLKGIAESKEGIDSTEREKIMQKIEELQNELSKETIHKPTVKKIKDFFVKYSDLLPLVTTAINTALSQL